MALLQSTTDPTELLDLWTGLALQCAALAARRREPTHLEDMNRAVRALRDAAPLSSHAMLAAELDLHLAIAGATRNGAIATFAEGMRAAVEDVLRTGYRCVGGAIARYRAIANAVADQNDRRAVQVMETQLAWIRAGLADDAWPSDLSRKPRATSSTV